MQRDAWQLSMIVAISSYIFRPKLISSRINEHEMQLSKIMARAAADPKSAGLKKARDD